VWGNETFLAIDFETASSSRASACAVGVALFEDGQPVETDASLINPGLKDEDWDAFNIQLHGIQPSDVRDAPTFPDIWKSISENYGGVPLLAHNASFDMSVIRAELARANEGPGAPVSYTCSAALARAAWPDLLSVALDLLANELEIELYHHQAESDALASGLIAVEAAATLECQSIDEALEKLHRRWGRIEHDLSWDTGTYPSGSSDLLAKDFQPFGDADPDHPLNGKTVVFTGKLHSMSRREAFLALAEAGGHPADSVTKKTDLLVVGDQDISRLAEGESMSSKQLKAGKLRQAGQDIEMIGESDFLKLL
jgi:DNA polymerase-3 subunit epsilon